MTNITQQVLKTIRGAAKQAAFGLHHHMIIVNAPAAAVDLIGTRLIDAELTENGEYVFLVNLEGLASTLKAYLKAQLGGTAAIVVAGPDQVALFDVDAIALAGIDDLQLTALATGDGSLVDDELLTASLNVTGGQFAMMTLTHSGSGAVTFDVAEFCGL
jgi:hypothetical protein